MAKKEKVQLTPEELAAKKLKRKKGWARFFAVVLAVAITAVVYVLGKGDGPKKVTVEPETVIEQVTVKVTEATTKAAETTTQAATTTQAETTTQVATTAPPSDDDSDNGILDTIMGLFSGLGDVGSMVDGNKIADTIDSAGSSAQDFFYGIADKVEESDGLPDDLLGSVTGS